MNKLITLYFIVLVVFHNTSIGQGCVGNLVTNGDFNNGLTGWTVVSSSPPGYNGYAPCTDWHIEQYPTSEFYAYNNCDHATNAQINQTISGLVSGNISIDFSIWTNDFDYDPASSGLLQVFFGGVKYAEIYNPPYPTDGSPQLAIVTTFNGATSNISSFPVGPIVTLNRYNLILSFAYTGGASSSLSFRFSTSTNEGDDFAIDKIKLCNCPTYTVNNNSISIAPATTCGNSNRLITGSIPSITPSTTFSYQWEFSSDNIFWNDILGANSKDYTSNMEGYYRRKIILANCNYIRGNVLQHIDAIHPQASGPNSVCLSNPSSVPWGIITLDASPAGGTWFSVAGNPSGVNNLATNYATGQGVLALSSTANGIFKFAYHRNVYNIDCEKDTITLRVGLQFKPIAPPDFTTCKPGTTTVLGTNAINGTWTTNAIIGVNVNNTGGGSADVGILSSAPNSFHLYYQETPVAPEYGCRDTTIVTAQLCYNVSGNVFNDANAMVDNYVNGTGIGSASGVQLYANLVNNSGVVIKSVPISSDGTYSFSEVPGTATSTSFILYTMRISTIEGTLGSAPPVNTLPPDWINTGEKVGTTAGTDPTVDGILTVQVRNADVTNVNFGIEQLPDSDSYSIPIAQPTVDQYVTLNGGTNPPILSGSDPEDGTLGTGSKVRITTLPTNGKLWYGGSAVYANQIISNFNPSLLQMQFTGSGYTETSFTYAFLDAGNKQDLSPATYTLSWGTPLPVHFLSFTTNVTRVKTVSIELITVNEQNLSSYIIERKTNNGVWESIGYFTPKNLVTLNKYQFIDENPSTQNQYRIKAINVDNTFEYTNVNIVQISFEGKVNVFPNPASGVLNITDAKPNSYIQIVSLEGKIIIETQINNNNQAIDISTISEGIYWARLLYNKKEYFIDKLFVKR